jgi:hypothetical protein
VREGQAKTPIPTKISTTPITIDAVPSEPSTGMLDIVNKPRTTSSVPTKTTSWSTVQSTEMMMPPATTLNSPVNSSTTILCSPLLPAPASSGAGR